MAWRLRPGEHGGPTSLVTVACHEDLTATDLVGRYLLARRRDGVDRRAAHAGRAHRARSATSTRSSRRARTRPSSIHPLTDHRRILPIEKTGELLEAHPDFLLVISYNPGYQSVLKDLKPSTRQRFVSLEFDYPARRRRGDDRRPRGRRRRRAAPSGWPRSASRCAHLREHGFEEGVSTRLLVYAAQLVDARHRAAPGVRRRHRPRRQRRRRGAAGGRRHRRRPAAVSGA